MARAAAIYDFTLTANGSFVLPVEGTYYRIRSATGSVQVKRDDGSLLRLEVGQGECNQLFKRLTLVDMSGAANSGTIIVADNNFVDERVSGEVAVINGGAVRALSNTAFSGGSTLNASVGNLNHIQLWNPAGSSKNLVLNSIVFNSFTGTAAYAFRQATVALATLVGNPASKKFGGAASVAEVRTDQPAASVAGTALQQPLSVQINTFNVLSFPEPFVIPPGFGVNVINATANSQLSANFDYLELPA